MEEKQEVLTCGFWLVRDDGKFGPCGKEATHQFHGNPLCSECAKHVMSIRGKVTEMSEKTIQKKLAYQRRKALRSVSA